MKNKKIILSSVLLSLLFGNIAQADTKLNLIELARTKNISLCF
jgi:hypothetical protein